MSHHHHSPDHSHHDSQKLKGAFFLNLTFTIIELVGGIYTNSVAIISDAVHDFGDSISLGLSWYLQRVSEKDSDDQYSYGYRRFSILGALINSIILILGSVFIVVESIPRLLHPETPDAEGMIYLAIGGIFFNSIAAYKLHGGHSINSRAVYLHLLEDVLSWAVTLVAAVLMHFFDLPVLDPLLAILIAIFISIHVVKNLRRALKIILQHTPDGVDIKEIHSLLEAMPEVKEVHDCHVWSMDGQYNVLSIHLVLSNTIELSHIAKIKRQAKAHLKELGIDHATIEFETLEEHCDPC